MKIALWLLLPFVASLIYLGFGLALIFRLDSHGDAINRLIGPNDVVRGLLFWAFWPLSLLLAVVLDRYVRRRRQRDLFTPTR